MFLSLPSHHLPNIIQHTLLDAIDGACQISQVTQEGAEKRRTLNQKTPGTPDEVRADPAETEDGPLWRLGSNQMAKQAGSDGYRDTLP